MFTAIRNTGREINPFVTTQHVIKAKVNGASTPFTLANNEKCSFGLYDLDHRLLGYIYQKGINPEYSKCAAINGQFDILINDAPNGSYLKKVESFFLQPNGGVTTVKH